MYKAVLPSKPGVSLSYSLHCVCSENDSKTPRILVFLNNLMMPASSWGNTVTQLKARQPQVEEPQPSSEKQILILTYDRFGQGATTDRDPLDSRPDVEKGYGHDFLDVVHDLHELLEIVVSNHCADTKAVPELFLVGASIGGPLVRLYAQTYPGSVSGILILDSNICNQNYSEFWPDAETAKANPELVVADDCSLEKFLEQSARLAGVFDLHVKNAESLDRRNTPSLLPFSDQPLLKGPDGKPVKVIVVGHDPVAFENEGLMRMGTPRIFNTRFVQPAWDEYNKGLLKVGEAVDGASEVIIAKGCGHFIQKDNPALVVDQIQSMLTALQW